MSLPKNYFIQISNLEVFLIEIMPSKPYENDHHLNI